MNSHRKPALWQRCDGDGMMMTLVCFQCVFRCPPCQSDSLTCGGGGRGRGCFLEESSLTSWSWLSRCFNFITNTRFVKVFCRWQTLFFGQKCEKESVGQAGGQTVGRTLLHVYLRYFLHHISCQITVTALLLFGHDMLLCGTFLCIKLSEGPVQLTERWPTCPRPHLQLIHSHWFGSPILRPYLQRHIWAGAKFHPSPHPRDSYSHSWPTKAAPKSHCEWG